MYGFSPARFWPHPITCTFCWSHAKFVNMLLVVAGGTQLCRLVALQTHNVNKVKMFFLMFKGEKFLCQMISNRIFERPLFECQRNNPGYNLYKWGF